MIKKVNFKRRACIAALAFALLFVFVPPSTVFAEETTQAQDTQESEDKMNFTVEKLREALLALIPAAGGIRIAMEFVAMQTDPDNAQAHKRRIKNCAIFAAIATVLVAFIGIITKEYLGGVTW